MQRSPSRILIIQTASIGDVILATALLESLHRRFPAARIDFLAKQGMEGLFHGHPFLNELLLWKKSEGKYRALINLIIKVRRKKYDLIVNVQRFLSSGMITALSGSPVRAGFSKNPLHWFFTRSSPHHIGEGLHETERNFSLISWIEGTENLRPRLYPGEKEKQAIQNYGKQKYITLAPASLWQTKQYPADQWIALLKALPPTLDVYLLGGPQDFPLCEEIRLKTGKVNVFNLCGKISLLSSAALMQGAAMNYMNDSAPLHLASAVNAPSAVVFCSTIPEFGFGPLSDKGIIIQTDVNLQCRPCGLHGKNACPEKHFDCARTISIDKLLNVL